MRVNWKCFSVETKPGRRFDPIARGRSLRVGIPLEWEVFIPPEKKGETGIQGRIIGIKKSRLSTEKARKKLRQQCSRKGLTVSKWALAMAAYIYIFTTLPKERLQSSQMLELYRARWQVELAFKQLKSILGLGHLPKINEETGKAWLHGKLLVALLAQAVILAGDFFSPWGYELQNQREKDTESLS